MLIPPPYPIPVASICPHGRLAIPDLPWSSAMPPVVATAKGMKSFRGMYTVMGNRGHGWTLTRYLPHVSSSSALVSSDHQMLESAIQADIHSVLTAGGPINTNPLLNDIALGIHLWGGSAGRGAFLRGGGFAVNCPTSDYATMIHLLTTHPAGAPLPGGNWPSIEALLGRFNHIKVAFLSKHFAFWTRALGSPLQLPVLDRVIFQTFISPGRLPAWKDYVPYVNQLEADRAIVSARPGLAGITISTMERHLFNWANSPAAAGWVR